MRLAYSLMIHRHVTDGESPPLEEIRRAADSLNGIELPRQLAVQPAQMQTLHRAQSLTHIFEYYHPDRGLARIVLRSQPAFIIDATGARVVDIHRRVRRVIWCSSGPHLGHVSDMHGSWWMELTWRNVVEDGRHSNKAIALLYLVWNCRGTLGMNTCCVFRQDPYAATIFNEVMQMPACGSICGKVRAVQMRHIASQEDNIPA